MRLIKSIKELTPMTHRSLLSLVDHKQCTLSVNQSACEDPVYPECHASGPADRNPTAP